MDTKIYVTSSLQASIPCPQCNNSYLKDVSKFMGHHTQVRLKYTCKCQHQFYVLLERRRCIRKPKQLHGYLFDARGKKVPLMVMDLSTKGLRVKLFGTVTPEKDSTITIKFTLDDPLHSKVETTVKVKRIISPNILGCEFCSPEHYDNLGKYFLFHF